jgi:predicted AlkP superfamily phosphohydrolase/phosphomutase
MLEDCGYRPEADMDLGVDNHLELIEDLDRVITARLAVFSRMLEKNWDLYLAVITDSDRINHFFWRALHHPGHALAEQVRGLYTRIDGFLGLVWQKYQPLIQAGEMSLLIVADHSFGPIETEVYLNRWLIDQGYLHIELKDGGERILPQTRALALDPGRIYLHQAGRFPNGAVFSEKQRMELLNELGSKLLKLKHPETGRRCMAKAFGKEDIYHGPYLDQAPDLVLQAMPGVSLRAGLGMPGVFGLSHLQGTHRPEGAMALWLGGSLDKTPDKVQGLFGLMAHALGLEDADK